MNLKPKARPSRSPLIALVLTLAVILSSCGATPTRVAISTTATTLPTASPSVTPSPSPTWTALPTVKAVSDSSVQATQTAAARLESTPTASSSPTSTPSATPSLTVTSSPAPSPWPTLGSSQPVTPTATGEPGPGSVVISATATITPTPTPTLTPTPMFSPTPMPTATFSGNVVHILALGLDSTHNLNAQNTDVIIVAAVNKDTKQVSLLSIPRDLWVYIPTHGWDRINTAHKTGHRYNYPGGGPALLSETIRINLGITIDHWVRIDFRGFARVVDQLGGVDMVVACPVNLRYMPPEQEGEEEMYLEPGVYHMDGDMALRYVRSRRGGTDFDRSRRQHQFLKAVWQQTKNPELLLKIPSLWSALKGSYETDLNLGDVLSLAPLALDLQPQRIRSRYISQAHTIDWETHLGAQVLLPIPEKIQAVVASLYAPSSGVSDAIAAESVGIQVRNGTYQPQLALIAADELRWNGFQVVDTGPADVPTYAETQIVVYREKAQALELLAKLLAIKPENVIYQLDDSQPADLMLILGRDYNPCR